MVQSSNSEEGDEIRIMISPVVEENTRKHYEASKVGSIQTLRKLIEEDKDMVQSVVIFCSDDIENPLHLNYNSPDELASSHGQCPPTNSSSLSFSKWRHGDGLSFAHKKYEYLLGS
ncbi:ankyrin repeat-containing protein [Cucumis melo var. makuwa]|uniref:Ankyrin repeat-containing protein n=1 Tax=Cucumis melo var. makuwa TaxID=1194695 RepID=A0A5A7SRP0_CUCMM|nr:ankyrin repeat-containing protein [Cucumis melo var. makuwa]TYK17130.1 ankyrin repeat-containing protein [Cucumis melo var. makuwa]